MDAQFAAQAEAPAIACGLAEALRIAHLEHHRIDRRLEPGDARGVHEPRTAVGERLLFRRPFEIEIVGVVAAAERQARDAGRCRGDRFGVDDAARGLDDQHQLERPGLEPRRTLARLDVRGDRLHVPGRLGLRQHDAIEPRPDHRVEIVAPERRVDTVDAHVAAGAARPAQRLDRERTRVRLLRERDRVLEIENHDIGADLEGLAGAAHVIGRRKEITAQPGGWAGAHGALHESVDCQPRCSSSE